MANVLDPYMADSEVSFLDKAKIQAQVLVPVPSAAGVMARQVEAAGPLPGDDRIVDGFLRWQPREGRAPALDSPRESGGYENL